MNNNNFDDWYDKNEKKFHQAHMDDKEIAYSAWNANKQDGFFDLEDKDICNHPSHKPPTLLNIPYGKGYRHSCPLCGKLTILINNIKYHI